MVEINTTSSAQNDVVEGAEKQAHVHTIAEKFNYVQEMRTASPAIGKMAADNSVGRAAVLAAGFPDTTITNNQVSDLLQRNADRTTSSALEALSRMQPASLADRTTSSALEALSRMQPASLADRTTSSALEALSRMQPASLADRTASSALEALSRMQPASLADFINDNTARTSKLTPEQMQNWSDLKNTSVNFNNALRDMHPKLQAAYNELPGNKGGTISHEQLKFLKEHSPEGYLLGTKYNQIHEKVFKEPTEKQMPSKKDLMKAEAGVDKAVAGMKKARQEEFGSLPRNPKDGSYTNEQLKFLKDYSKDGYAAAQDYNRILNNLMSNIERIQQGGQLNRLDIPQGERPESQRPSLGNKIYPKETAPAPTPRRKVV